MELLSDSITRTVIKLQHRNEPGQFVGVTEGVLTIGRDPDNDLTIDEPSISDFHAELRMTADGLSIVDLLSVAGTFVNDERVGRHHAISAWDIVRIGNVELEINDPAVRRPNDWALRGQSDLLAGQYLTLKPLTIIGRGSDCDLTIDDSSLSRHHAQLTIENQKLRVRDLSSANGTYVNGVKILDEPLGHDDTLRIGSREFVVIAPAELKEPHRKISDATEVQDSWKGGDTDSSSVETEVLGPRFPRAYLLEQTGLLGERNRLDMESDAVCLGRGPDNDIVIADVSVSRVHARLTAKGYRWEIEDMQSSNGVQVNGKLLESVTLRDGDVITLGRLEFRFCYDPV